MTTTFGIDQNNDIYLNNEKNLAVLTGINAVVDAVKTATQAQLGEMVLETGQGIPNFETIWIGTPNYSLWESYLRNTIMNIDGVQELQSLQLQKTGDVLTYTATIKTIYGTAAING